MKFIINKMPQGFQIQANYIEYECICAFFINFLFINVMYILKMIKKLKH